MQLESAAIGCLMSKKGRTVDFTAQKKTEIYNAFRDVLESVPPYTPIFDIAKKAIELPCSRYWISPEQAWKTISAILRGKLTLISLTPHRRKMILSIMQRCNDDYTLPNVESVVLSSAPKYYITAGTALILYYQHLNSLKRCNRKKLQHTL